MLVLKQEEKVDTAKGGIWVHTRTRGVRHMTSSEKKRLDWLTEKSRAGRLTKQEQLELGAAHLEPIRQKESKHRK